MTLFLFTHRPSGDGSVADQPPLRQLPHPERYLTILFIATAILLAFIGTTLGAFTLANLAGAPTTLALDLFPAHPYLQIYGFIAEFVVGVAYSLLPRFKIGGLPSPAFGFATYALLTAGNTLFVFSSVGPTHAIGGLTAGAIAPVFMLAASVIFASQVSILAARHVGGFPETNLLMVLCSTSLILISLATLLIAARLLSADVFSAQMIFLALLGFAGSMIYTVEIRSVSFRQCNYRKPFARLAPWLQALAIGATFLSLFFAARYLLILGALLYLAAALNVIGSIRIFEFAHPLMYRPAMKKMHFAIVRYNEVGIASGSSWLIFGCLAGIALAVLGNSENFFVRDSFIHSVAIGFIGSSITVFAPMLLPGLLGRKAPITGLSMGPIILLNAGILFRVVGDATTLEGSSPSLPIWESLSGPAVLGAMIWLLIVLPRIGRKQRQQQQQQRSASLPLPEASRTSSHSDQQFRDVRDAMITVTGRRSGRQIAISVWFVQKDKDSFYLIPKGGKRASNWYRDAVANPNVKLEIDRQVFSATAHEVLEASQVHSIIRMFKDKYGDRVYRNFYGDLVDGAMLVVIQSPVNLGPAL